MSKDPTIAIRDCLAEIDILHRIASGATLATHALRTVLEAMLNRHDRR
jgi:hypothetical protein